MRLLSTLLTTILLTAPCSGAAPPQGQYSVAYKVSPVVHFIRKTARAEGVNPDFILAVGEVESDLRVNAVGGYGERGPLQVLPRTFRALGGRDIYDWQETTKVGVSYFARCLRKAKGNYALATIYYNAGEGRLNARAVAYAHKVSRHYSRRLSREQASFVERWQHAPYRIVNPKCFENWNQNFQVRPVLLLYRRQFQIPNRVLRNP